MFPYIATTTVCTITAQYLNGISYRKIRSCPWSAVYTTRSSEYMHVSSTRSKAAAKTASIPLPSPLYHFQGGLHPSQGYMAGSRVLRATFLRLVRGQWHRDRLERASSFIKHSQDTRSAICAHNDNYRLWKIVVWRSIGLDSESESSSSIKSLRR